MSTIDLPLSRIDAACLNSLLTNGVAEGRQLEYKEQLPGDDDKAKHEFLADTTSFANSVGGDLIYGIGEARDAAGAPTGTPEAIIGLPGVNLDQAQLRLEDLLRQCVDPRLHGVTFHPIQRGSGPPCLLVRVPQSPLRLHMVTFKGAQRFYGRGASGRFQLDVRQIRAGFLESEMAEERVGRFRLERVTRVFSGDTPIAIGEGARVVFHALPLTPLKVWPVFLTVRRSEIPNFLKPLVGHANNWRHNLDGFVVYAAASDLARQSYTQPSRDGGIEAASGLDVAFDPRRRGLYGLGIEIGAIGTLTMAQRLWKVLGVTGPLVLGLALSGIRGWKILGGPDFLWDPDETFNTDVAALPEVVVEDESMAADQALKPLFDVLWNAGGWERSPFYLPTGERKQPPR